MNTLLFRACSLASLTIAIAMTSIYAQVPRQLSVQMYLTDWAKGIPYPDGTYTITFSLYADPDAEGSIYTYTDRMPVTGGIVNALIGPIPPNVSFDRQYWLGIAMEDGSEMRPRTPLTSSPYAFNLSDAVVTTAKLADGAVTAKKMGTDYIAGMIINGEKISGRGRLLEVRGADDIALQYDGINNVLSIGKEKRMETSDPEKRGATILAGTATDEVWSKSGDIWDISAGASVSPASTDWIGTSNNVSFTIKVDDGGTAGGGNQRVMEYQPNATSANILGGHSSNSIGSGYGNIIAGGGGTSAGSNIIGNGADYNVIGGGANHNIPDSVRYAVIAGGESNVVSGTWATVAGGGNNVASSYYATVGGGLGNTASSGSSVVGGGIYNSAAGFNATVSGGYNNSATDDATVGGGADNAASFRYATVGGGNGNTASGREATVGGGVVNTASGWYSTVGGGDGNNASAEHAVIAGGSNNIAAQLYTSVGGGFFNHSLAIYGAIGGGSHNSVNAAWAMIGGGYLNVAAGQTSSIPGGGLLTLDSDADRSFGFLASDFSSNLPMTVNTPEVAVFGNADLWLANNDNTASALLFYEANSATGLFPLGTNYTSFQAGSQSSDIAYILPLNTTPSAIVEDGLLQLDAATGQLSWVDPGAVWGSGLLSPNSVVYTNATGHLATDNPPFAYDDVTHTMTTENLTVLGTSDLQGRVWNSIGDLQLDDNVAISGMLDVQGRYNAIGDGSASRQLTIRGVVDAAIGDSIAPQPDVWDLVVEGDFGATGIAKFGGSLWIDGVTPGDHRIVANDMLDVGTSTFSDLTFSTNGTTAIVVDGWMQNVTVNNTLMVGWNVDIGNHLNVDANTTLRGTLDQWGIVFNSTGDVVVGDDANITGSADIDIDLNVDGNTVHAGVLDQQGAVLNSSGNLVVYDNLEVAGSTILSYGTNSGGSTIPSNVTVFEATGSPISLPTSATDGQILYVVNSTGSTITVNGVVGGSGGSVALPAVTMWAFVYANGWYEQQ